MTCLDFEKIRHTFYKPPYRVPLLYYRVKGVVKFQNETQTSTKKVVRVKALYLIFGKASSKIDISTAISERF